LLKYWRLSGYFFAKKIGGKEMDYFIKLPDGTKVPVNEGVYRAYKRPQWREMKYLKKKIKRPQVSYDQLVRSGFPIEQYYIPEPSAEELAGDVIMLDKLRAALEQLAEEERALMRALYYEYKTEREYAKSIGVSKTTVLLRRRKILAKLRKLVGGQNWQWNNQVVITSESLFRITAHFVAITGKRAMATKLIV
jgi:RNA polymerase sigma factor (sigma-70 family)